MEKVRICKICGEEKPISDFYPCYAKKDWYRKECKQCTLLTQKEYALKHKVERSKYLKKYNKENRERIREVSQRRKNERLRIDHIVPLVEAQTEEQVKQLCHYTNLRLVTPEENFKKGLKERRINEQRS